MSSLVVSSMASTLAALLALGCGGATPGEEPNSPEAAVKPATFAEQVSLGQALFGEHCAQCHGSSGQGGDGPRLVGLEQGALPLDPLPSAKFRKTQFKTVADVATFVVANMPPTSQGA